MATMPKTRTGTMRRALLGLVAVLGIVAVGVTALPASDAAAGGRNVPHSLCEMRPASPGC